MNIFKNAFDKIKGIVTGGSDSTTEKTSALNAIRNKEEKSQSEINHLHNYNAMMNKRKAIRRMRNKMRRETQQAQK